jgi:hypothetical protein
VRRAHPTLGPDKQKTPLQTERGFGKPVGD